MNCAQLLLMELISLLGFRKAVYQISIEHYFTDEEIKTELEGKRLFIGNEFYKTGVCKSNRSLYYKSGARVADTIKIIEHESNNYVMNADGTGDYSISKSKVAVQKSLDEAQLLFDSLMQHYFG